MSNNKPTYYVYGEVDRGRRQPQLIRIGAAWPHKEGTGIGLQIDSLPLTFNGRLVLFEPKDGQNGGDADDGRNYPGAGEE
jgi:hypothetical protein